MDNMPRQNYRSNNFRGKTRGYSRQNNRGNYRNERYNSYNRDRVGQEKEHLQEITVVTETEVQVIADQDQGLDLIQIGTG